MLGLFLLGRFCGELNTFSLREVYTRTCGWVTSRTKYTYNYSLSGIFYFRRIIKQPLVKQPSNDTKLSRKRIALLKSLEILYINFHLCKFK